MSAEWRNSINWAVLEPGAAHISNTCDTHMHGSSVYSFLEKGIHSIIIITDWLLRLAKNTRNETTSYSVMKYGTAT